MHPTLCWLTVPGLILLATFAVRADVTPNSLFSDNAVLPRDIPLPVWGTAADGENVMVELDGKSATATAKDGQWKVILPPHAAGGPYTLTIRGANTLTLHNILLGDVWIASGQSNMERQLGPRPPQPPIDDWQKEAAAADYPRIREYYVPEVSSLTPVADVNSHWTVCSPQTVADYSAVGYFFARDVHKATKIPIGIIFSAWGGTRAESWTSIPALKALPAFAPIAQKVEDMARLAGAGPVETPEKYFAANDPGSAPGHGWEAPDFDAGSWPSAPGAAYDEHLNTDAFQGIVWTRREIDLPPAWAGRAAVLHLGQVDDNDTTFVNGVQVGATEGWKTVRNYKVPPNVLKAGRNVVAVRIVNVGGGGGMIPGDGNQFALEMIPSRAAPSEAPVALACGWRYQTSTPLGKLPPMPSFRRAGPGDASVLFNGMITPFLPFPIKGVIWYQAEANTGQADQYRTLFPALIADWRRQWGIGDFPFLFVQLAPWSGTTPEIREAQFLTLHAAPNTAMVVTTDVGDAGNIHPSHKAPVGARLALAARALAYHEDIEYSGPLYQSMRRDNGRVTVRFEHAKGGLVAKDGPLRGFTIAGEDGNFVPAQASVQGDAVTVSSAQVPAPAAVRYGWANVPDGNLFNQAGLPASPFRTDDFARVPPAESSVTPSDGSYRAHLPWNMECAERVAAMKGKPCDLIFIGDSITQNFVEEPKPKWPLVGKTVWDKYYVNRHALDFGVGADATQHVLWRLDHMDIEGFKPKVAVVLIGVNNAQDTPPDIAAGVKAVVTKTQAIFPGVKVILVSILPTSRQGQKMVEANRIIQTFGDDRSVFYFDLASKMTPVGDNWKGVGFDHLHLTPEGYELWASSMEPLLTQLLAGSPVVK